jgi:hypothetical protein
MLMPSALFAAWAGISHAQKEAEQRLTRPVSVSLALLPSCKPVSIDRPYNLSPLAYRTTPTMTERSLRTTTLRVRSGALLAIATAFLASLSAFAATPPTYDRAAWLADFESLRDTLTRGYPNLEWAVERGMDLPALQKLAISRLEAATDDAQARRAMERFVAAFGDGHLQIIWPSAGSKASHESDQSAPLCRRFGYESPTDTSAIGARLPGYVALDEQDPWAAGIVTREGKRVAILRIERFGPLAPQCAAALTELKLSESDACDESCEKRVRARVDALYVAGMERRLRALESRQPDLLLIDLATNGGGDDSSIALARMLGADGPTPVIAHMRGERLDKYLAELQESLAKAAKRAARADRPLYERTLVSVKAAAKEASAACDRSPLWRGEPISCSGLVRGPFYAGGLVDRGIIAHSEDSELISATSRYTFTPGFWSRPVAFLVDGNTASSAELLAAMLQDAKRAFVVGSPTFGAGCGWMLPPQPTTLPRSGGVLHMSDCSRFRADGRNEVEGITPDVLIAFRRYDTPKQRVMRLEASWPAVFAKIR